MILYVVLDTEEYGWSVLSDPKQLINNLLIFINTFLLLSYENRVILVNKKEKAEFDFNRPIFEENGTIKSKLLEIIEKNVNQSKNNSFVNDIGYTLTIARNHSTCFIVIVSLNKEHPDEYIKYIKLSFISKRFNQKYKIYIFSQFDNPTLSEIGYFYKNFELNSFLKVFYSAETQKNVFCKTYCFCHKKEILLGLVCPVCLAVYCSFVPVCKKCRIKFNIRKKALV